MIKAAALHDKEPEPAIEIRHKIDLDPSEWEGGAKEEAKEALFREKGEFQPGPLRLNTERGKSGLFRYV